MVGAASVGCVPRTIGSQAYIKLRPNIPFEAVLIMVRSPHPTLAGGIYDLDTQLTRFGASERRVRPTHHWLFVSFPTSRWECL